MLPKLIWMHKLCLLERMDIYYFPIKVRIFWLEEILTSRDHKIKFIWYVYDQDAENAKCLIFVWEITPKVVTDISICQVNFN